MTRLSPGAFVLALFAASVVAALPHSVQSQSLAVGRLGGVVLEAGSGPIRNAEVRVVDRSGGTERSASTLRDGSFRFDAIPDGRYDLLIEALGYVPLRYLDVRVAAGFARFVEVRLESTPPPVTRVDTVPRRGDAGSLGQWLIERGYGDLLGSRRFGGDAAGFSAAADVNGVEGLPWRFASSVVDGARFGSASAPVGSGADAFALALPVRAIASATAGGLGYDAEIGGTGVGLRATTRRGGGVPAIRTMAEGGSASLGGAYEHSGSLQGDTAQAIFGVDFQRSEREFWDLASTPNPRVAERVGLYGRLDWQGSDRLAISARASGGRYTSNGQSDAAGIGSFYGPSYEGTAGQASLNVIGRLTRRISHEWRVGVDVGQVEGSAAQTPRAFDVNSLASGSSALGTPFRELRATPRVSGLLHFDAGVHRLKTGFTAASSRVESALVRDSDGLYSVGGIVGTSVEGAWRSVSPNDADVNLRLRETSLFVQDDWQVVDGLTLLLGLRLDRFLVPAAGIERNSEWLAASGLDNSAVESISSAVSPRVAFRWELGRNANWVIEGGAGTYRDSPDTRDLAEALSLDRGADVRLGVGSLPFATAPDFMMAPVVGRTLSMLAPDFAGSRTNRLSLGLTRRVGAWSASLSGVYRMTDGLSRRQDLNLPAFEAGRDQYGRPLYGQLQQLGSTVLATPRSNRRFAEFDAVYALEASGFSEFYGATLGIERVQERGVSVMALYTFSRTLDNIASLSPASISPFSDGFVGVDWREGRGDLDVPHRATVALEWRPVDALSFGAIYRLRSGLPFTPGFRGGVDANGDGDWSNDPAFVDAALPGMSAVIAQHGCLSTGEFVERNSCRGDWAQSVDLRAAFRLARTGIGRVDLVVDAVDLVSANNAPLDAALLLVDPAAALSVNPGTGVTTVPLTVNPAFGEAAVGRSPGVFWRIGLRVTP